MKRLTDKQRLFVKYKTDNPGISNKDALLKAGYKPKNDHVAAVMANQMLNRPKVAMKLQENADIFESVIVGTAKDWAKHDKPRQREIALQAAMFGHDKAFGKSTVRIEQQVSVVKVLINLTGDGEEPPEFIEA